MTIPGYQVATALPIDWKRSGPLVRGVGGACRCVGVENVHVTALRPNPRRTQLLLTADNILGHDGTHISKN
jgi:hypothetical protein